MADLTTPCKQCGAVDRYVKGKFSYCRPCHNEAQRRYAQNRRMGIRYEHKKPPVRTLSHMLTRTNGNASITHCPRNHPYTGDNVRIEEQDGRLHRRCRACERDAKRVRYGLAPEPDPVRLTDLLDGTL